jgi:hypothetical protein
MGKQKTPSIVGRQRLPDLLQEPDQLFQLALGKLAQKSVMQVSQRLIQGRQRLRSKIRQDDVDDRTILLAADSVYEASLFQSIDKVP